jgi:hypothetical protein
MTDLNIDTDLNFFLCPKLKRSTQQYCQKCMYMCSEYGLEKCPKCNNKFEDNLRSNKKIKYSKKLVKN